MPLKRYPNTYNGQPLPYVGLGAQKLFYAVYLNCIYIEPELMREFRAAFERAGKKVDMGKSCVRFKRVEDLPLDAIAKVVAATSVEEFIAYYEKSRGGR